MKASYVTVSFVSLVMGLFLVVAYGCAEQQGGEATTQGDAAIVVVDDAGREFTFDAPPERIAACAAFALETLMALDHPPVARFEAADLYPPEAESIPTVARTHSVGPDVEQLIAAQPDLIILHKVFESFAPEVEQAVGVPVMVMRIDSVEGVRDKVRMFGTLTGKPEEAEALLADLDAAAASVDSRVAGKKPVALSLLGNEDTWYAHRQNHFMGSLLDTAGALNVAASDDAHAKYKALAPLDLEAIIVKDPDVIFLIPYGDADRDMVIKRFKDHPATQSLRAVRAGRLHVLPDTIYTRQPGPRTGEALQSLVDKLYPDAGADAQ